MSSNYQKHTESDNRQHCWLGIFPEPTNTLQITNNRPSIFGEVMPMLMVKGNDYDERRDSGSDISRNLRISESGGPGGQVLSQKRHDPARSISRGAESGIYSYRGHVSASMEVRSGQRKTDLELKAKAAEEAIKEIKSTPCCYPVGTGTVLTIGTLGWATVIGLFDMYQIAIKLGHHLYIMAVR